MKAVILAAGDGKRIWPLSMNRPKPLINIINKNFLEYQIISLKKAGIKDIVIIISPKYRKVFEEFRKKIVEKHGCTVSFLTQKEPRGTGNAFYSARIIINEPFIGLMGDNHYTAGDIKRVINCYKNTGKNVIGGIEVEHPEHYGVIYHNKEGFVTDLVEKPKKSESNLINAAIYLLKPYFFRYLKDLDVKPNGETYVTDGLSRIIKYNDLIVQKINNWIDLGYPHQVLHATEFFFKNFRKYNNPHGLKKIENNIYAGKNVKIGKNVEIMPDEGIVIIEENSVIRGNSVIEGNCYIGKNCTIIKSVLRNNSVLMGGNKVSFSECKNSSIGYDSNLPHFNYLGDSYVGNNCNFGAGAKIANLRHDNKSVKMFLQKKGFLMNTGMRKLGIFTGDNVKFGINSGVGQPGVLISSDSKIMPNKTIYRNVTT